MRLQSRFGPPKAEPMRNFWFVTSGAYIVPWRAGSAFDLALLEERDGFISFRARGNGARKRFLPECGGHRWQNDLCLNRVGGTLTP